MLMFLTLLFAGVLVTAVMLAIADPVENRDDKPLELGIPIPPASFFASDTLRHSAADDPALDVMLAQIEQHVRLERAAAECFLELPTPDNLQSAATSPLAN